MMGVRAAPVEPGGTWKEKPLDALKEAITILNSLFGRLDPEWGAVNRFRRGTFNSAVDGGPDVYRAVYGKQQDDGTLTAVGGDTLIMFVTWDKDGKLSSESIHQFGSATLDEASPHYADQSPLFVKMQMKPVWFTEDQLAGHIAADYRPGHHRQRPALARRPVFHLAVSRFQPLAAGNDLICSLVSDATRMLFVESKLN